ncbi:MAG: hypothetical protein ACJ0A6_02755 [Dehalococcoidia bacterium]
MNNLEFSNLIHGIIQTKFPKLENRLEIIVESRANNDQIYGSGIKNSDELICLIETIPTINENIINAPPDGRLIFFQDTIEKYYVTRNEIQEAITNEINEYLN